MPHSILKNTVSSISAQARDDRNRETALYHAQLLQQRKDVEALILASTEALLELPSSSAADPARPCLQDTVIVKNSLKPFQPSDYDSLIEERNINKQCGYVLCPRPNRQEDTKAKYRILPGRKGDTVNFVERHTLERWCSDACGKRALYVKVQLCEEPGWTRAGSAGGDIVFLEDERNNQKIQEVDSTLTEKLRSLDMGLEEDEVITKMNALAIERGDKKAPSRSFGLAEIDVREKNINSTAFVKASSGKVGDLEDSIEGYTPKFARKEAKDQDSDNDTDEDLMPNI